MSVCVGCDCRNILEIFLCFKLREYSENFFLNEGISTEYEPSVYLNTGITI